MDFDPKEFIAQNSALQPQGPGGPVDQFQMATFDPKDFISKHNIAAQDELQAKYGTASQQALAGLEALGRGATLGGTDVLETKLLGVNPEEIKKRREANPVTSFVGTGLGGAGLFAATGGLGGLGAGIEGAVGKGLLGHALGSGAEGAVFGAGNVISDAALGDPNLNAQKVIANLGTGFALGAGFGALGYGLGKLFGKAKTEAPSSISPQQALADEGLVNQVPTTEAENYSQFGGAPNEGTLRESFPIEALPEADQSKVVEGLNNLKHNADDIIKAGQDLGAPVPEGMLSNDEHIQKLDYSLTNSPSPQGVARNRLYNSAWNKANQKISDTLGTKGDLSLAQTGEQAKQVLSDALEKRYQPIKDLYSEIQEVYPEIPVSEGQTKDLSKAMNKMVEDHALIKGTPEHSFVTTFADGASQINNLNKLKAFRTALGRATTPQTKFVSGLIKDELDNLENSSIKSFASTIADPEAKQYAEQLVSKIGEAKSQYSGFRDQMGKIGKVLFGGKKIYGPQDFLDKIEAETPEKFATRLFSKNNSQALEYLNQEFPEVIQLLSQLEKNKLRDSSLIKGEFNANKFLNNLHKNYEPEIRNILFNPEEQRIFNSGKVYFDNFLPDFNPSGTAGGVAYHEWIKNPKASALSWLADLGTESRIKGAVNLTPEQKAATMMQAEQMTKMQKLADTLSQGTEKIKQGVKAIFNDSPAAKGAIFSGGAYLSDKAYDQLTQNINNFMANPQILMDDIASNTQPLYGTAPHIAQGLSTTLMRKVAFLNSKMPKPPATYPLGPKWQPSQNQKAQFKQYYDAVNEPLKALDMVKKGTMNVRTMEALQAVHPELLNEMRQKVMLQMTPERTKNLTYPQRLSLSQFLGQPLDANMTPQAIMSNQATFGVNVSSQNGAKSGRKSPLGGLKQLDLSDRSATRTGKREED